MEIYGDGMTSRDFCYIHNAIQANLLAGLTKNKGALNQAYNVACGAKTTLNELYSLISKAFRRAQHPAHSARNASGQHAVGRGQIETKNRKPLTALRLLKSIAPSNKVYLKVRIGDIQHSLADVSKARNKIGYKTTAHMQVGIAKLVGEIEGQSL